MKQKLNQNSLQVVEVKEIPETPGRLRLFTRDVRYLKVKDVKRAYSKLIQDYCKGLVTNEDAKTVTYMFSGYLQLIRDVEFEDRLKEVEEKISDEKL
ncbi:MAG: hypothetical protein IPH11_04850 [Ignavibacteriales bacterium]|nr:hypothetical protein [Ignavibacteriales bacterium]